MFASREFTADCPEEIPALHWREHMADLSDCLPDIIEGSGACLPQMSLELRKGHFNGIEIWGLFRQEQKPCADISQDLLGFFRSCERLGGQGLRHLSFPVLGANCVST